MLPPKCEITFLAAKKGGSRVKPTSYLTPNGSNKVHASAENELSTFNVVILFLLRDKKKNLFKITCRRRL